jgi:hypothetical protein
MTVIWAPSFEHLRSLTDAGGLYEHADHTSARLEHGYCLDDVARGLVVVSRESDPELDDLRELYLDFVLAAAAGDGQFCNRRDSQLRWQGAPSTEDCWGRALWGLGCAVADPRLAHRRPEALAAFTCGAARRTPSPRSMAFAALGAAELLREVPRQPAALEVLRAAAEVIGNGVIAPGAAGSSWPWPEPRLAYANAALPEALIAAGEGLGDPLLSARGLRLLDWLLARETRRGHLSVTPAGGHGPEDDDIGFDQQPIEAAALADACARAHAVTGADRYARGIEACAGWFMGVNDTGVVLWNPSGGGCDGLHKVGRNENQGAESTLALLSTLQQAQRCAAMQPVG